jgi:hypothetical protein
MTNSLTKPPGSATTRTLAAVLWSRTPLLDVTMRLFKSGMGGYTPRRASASSKISSAVCMLYTDNNWQKGLSIIHQAAEDGFNISKAVPVLKRLYPYLEGEERQISLALLISHHLKNHNVIDLAEMLRSDDPEVVSSTLDSLSFCATIGRDISPFVSRSFDLLRHSSNAVAISAYAALESAAMFNENRAAIDFINLVHSGPRREC